MLRVGCSASGCPRVLAVTVCGMSRPALSRLVCAIPLTPIADSCRRALGRARWRPRPMGSGSARALVFGSRLCRLTWALLSHNVDSRQSWFISIVVEFFCGLCRDIDIMINIAGAISSGSGYHRGFKLLLRQRAVSSLIAFLTSIVLRYGAITPPRSALFAYRLRGQCPRPL